MGLSITEVPVENLPIEPTLMWNGIPLFDAADGVELIDYCWGNNIAVLGVEGFKIEGGRRVPKMDCIIDFSASLNEEGFAKKSVEACRTIIESIDSSDVLMEF